MDPIHAVTFDAGNTLLRVRGSVGEVYAQVAARHGIDAQPETMETAFQQAFAGRRRGFLARVSRPHSEAGEKAWWRALVAEVFRSAGLLGAASARFDGYFEDLFREFARAERWEVYPDVFPCLDTLDRLGLSLGVVSNWDSRLRQVLAGVGLLHRFRFVLISAEFGVEKPDPAIFLAAAERAGARPHQVLHVGDLLRDDVEGARAAGLRGVQVRRGGCRQTGVPCVAGLDELARTLTAGEAPGLSR